MHMVHSTDDNDAFHCVMAGLPGLSPLVLNHQKIQTAVGYGQVNITTYHNRPHLFQLDNNKSRIDKDRSYEIAGFAGQ